MTDLDRSSRESSRTSDSTGSCIVVGGSSDANDTSTRPTSLASSINDAIQKGGGTQDARGRRSSRLSGAFMDGREPSVSTSTGSQTKKRNLSGATLVSQKSVDSPTQMLLDKGTHATGSRGDFDARSDAAKMTCEQGRRSGRIAVAASTIASTASALGKRSREVLEGGKKRFFKGTKRKSLRPRNENGLAVVKTRVEEEPPRKRTRFSITNDSKATEDSSKPVVVVPRASKKKWLLAGLYVGQENDFDPRLTEAKNKLKRAVQTTTPSAARTFLPLPMFAGARVLERGRPFKLPFDVFSPLPPGQPKPEEWRKTQSNRFFGDAASEWKKIAPLPPSNCTCSPEGGCDEDCLNRFMLYECDQSNCNIGPAHCTNRSFAELKERVKSGRKYHIGVEVMKTAEKGFGVRACRTFNPHQIIVEYAGEIITPEECERRMNDEYKNAECYYLMNFDQNMIIDATRGSIARFVNHSCEPNCKMVKWIVAGKPRMALFAGAKGIMTGEELTYDYCQTENFLWGKQCQCGMPSCRGILGPKPPQEKLQPQSSTKALAGTKRKLQQAFRELDQGRKKQTAGLKKKRRAVAAAVRPKQSATRPQKRIASDSTGHTTLIDKENFPQPTASKLGRTLSNRLRTVGRTARGLSTGRRGGNVLRSRASNLQTPISSKQVKVKTTLRRTTTVTSVRNASSTAKQYLKSIRGSNRVSTTAKVGRSGGVQKSVRIVLEE